MAGARKIDERDIDRLLAALTDRQIANLFDIEESEVSRIRKSRRGNTIKWKPNNDSDA